METERTFGRRADDNVNHRITVLEQKLDSHLRECSDTNARVEKALDRVEGEVKEYIKSANSARDVLHSRITSVSSDFKSNLIWGLFTILITVCGGFGAVLWFMVKEGFSG